MKCVKLTQKNFWNSSESRLEQMERQCLFLDKRLNIIKLLVLPRLIYKQHHPNKHNNKLFYGTRQVETTVHMEK